MYKQGSCCKLIYRDKTAATQINCSWTSQMNRSVLIVDDDEDLRLLLHIMLERSGFAVAEAGSGQEALRRVKEVRPDVVVLDVMMPDMNGLETCRALRAEEATADLPVIMLSARMNPNAVAAGLEAGATEYLTKPVSYKELARIIGRVTRSPMQSTNGNGR